MGRRIRYVGGNWRGEILAICRSLIFKTTTPRKREKLDTSPDEPKPNRQTSMTS